MTMKAKTKVERVPKSFKSPGGRRFIVSSHIDRSASGPYRFAQSRAILKGGKQVGKLWESDSYGPELPWQVTTRELSWGGGGLPPHGIGFDGGPHATVSEALAEFGRIADQVLDWRAGKRVRSIYSKTGSYQKPRGGA